MKTALTRTKLLASALIVIAVIGGATYHLLERRDTNGLLDGPEFSEAQLNEGGADDIKDLPLPEAKKRLNYLILDMRDSINRLAMLESMRLEIGPAATPEEPQAQKELNYEKPFVPFTDQDLKAALTALAQTPMQFQQVFFDNGSGLNLDVETIRDTLKRGALPDQPMKGSYQIQTVHFRDGTQQPFAEVALEQAGSEEESDNTRTELTVNKPIERISVALNYQAYPGFRKIQLDQANPKATGDNGEVYQLTALGDSRASLQLATPKRKAYVIQGLTADGKTLYSGGSSSNTAPTAEQTANLRAYYNELLRMEDAFTDFKTAAAVQEHLENFANNLPSTESDLSNVQATYQFEDTPASIVIYLLEPAQPQTIALQMTNNLAPRERYIAFDSASEKKGFIDSKGQWVVKPRFERIEYTEMPDVYQMMVGEKSSGEGWSQLLFKYFAFVPGTQTLKELPFDSIDKPINDRLMVVQRETNGPYGVYDVKKLQTVVPMKYVNPNVIGEVFIARPGQKTYGSNSLYGAWSLSGKELLAPVYSAVDGQGAFIYATSADKHQTDVYDLHMKKLNPSGATVIGQFVQAQPLLIQDRNSRRYSFINEQGKALAFSLPFDDVNPFSNGMAVVQKGNRYGAIDVYGKLRIPVTYSKLNPFQKNLASAQMDGFEGLVLIDKNNSVVKKLGSYTSYSYPYNSNEATYSIWDTQVPNRINVFDADGNQTDSFERE
ncbi:kwg repeat domain protein [Pseudomonas fluorescens]|uniref:Kwg repeat domain protein n=1 Tax=Pseudomonas fluorescens TaxID=294 RepID=A0A379IFL9_PSEFL|nr:WG repeat-containing protein [Pseudomonas fluorescens]AIG01813.1 hypothetical protein HZ99_06425 [Pseudomonas fluorescens]SUD31605.1 kwg repeat domain protein [Pseudomonas fluorescens]